MKRKMKLLCAALCVVLVVGVAYAASGAGSANDPLITLSYLTNVFAPKVDTEMTNRVNQKAQELTGQFDQKLQEVPTSSGGESSAFAVVTLTKGQVLTGDIGCEVMLRVGSAACVSSGSTGLIDVTDGSVLDDGDKLEKNHLYMVTISTRGVKATADTVKVLVRGPYNID